MNQSSDLIELSELAAVCARELERPIAQAGLMIQETLEQGGRCSSAVTVAQPRTRSIWQPNT